MPPSNPHATTKPTRFLSYLIIFALPLSAFWPLGPPTLGYLTPHYDQPALFWADIPLLALLLALLIKRPSRTTPIPELHLALITIITLAFITAPFALYPTWAFYTACRWLFTLTIYYWFQQKNLPLTPIITCFLLTLSLHTLIGLAQIYAQQPLGLPAEMTLPITTIRASILQIPNQPNWLRPYGLTFHPNVLGGYLAVALILAIPRLNQPLIRLLTPLLCLGLFLTFSRSAWLATTLTLLPLLSYLLWQKQLNHRPLLQTSLLTILTLSLAVLIWHPQLRSRLPIPQPISSSTIIPTSPAPQNNPPPTPNNPPPPDDVEHVSLNERLQLNQAAIRSIIRHPLTGVGAGNFSQYVARYETRQIHPHPVHNVFLLIFTEISFIGAACWLLIWLTCLQLLYRHAAHASPTALAFITALFALGLISLFDFYPWGLPAGQRLFLFLFALVNRTWTSL
ncbi:MAG TPA: O-antigen ligase family protein [Anaerolineae bacterium]|nr:O-antigen ligase family protein [Anaerolineae bacterium]